MNILDNNKNQNFLEGLKKHNLTLKDIEDSRYFYCGGDKGPSFNYWKKKTKGLKIKRPNKTLKCICGHKILHNFYIANEDFSSVMVLGSTCIQRFIGTEKTCNVCGVVHKNRIVDRCNSCRKGLCDVCDQSINAKYKKCYYCKHK